MTRLPEKAQFACHGCGCPSIVIPARIADDAIISCGGCHSPIGSWLAYKAFVSRSICLETTGMGIAPPTSADPISKLSLDDSLAGL